MSRKQEELVSAWTIHLVVVVREVFGNLWKTDFQDLLCISLGIFLYRRNKDEIFLLSSFFFHSCIQKTQFYFSWQFSINSLSGSLFIHSIVIDKFRFQLICSQSIKVCSIKGGFGCHRSVEYMFVFSCITLFLASLSLHCPLSMYVCFILWPWIVYAFDDPHLTLSFVQ